MSDERLIEIGTDAFVEATKSFGPVSLDCWNDAIRPTVREAFAHGLAAVFTAAHTAGYLIIPPLDTPEGREAVERGAAALIDADPTISGYHEDHLAIMRPRTEASLRAAGGRSE